MYIAIFLLLAFAYEKVKMALYRQKLSTCGHPMPGARFVFVRCIPGNCYWCDQVDHYLRYKDGHPYRTARHHEEQGEYCDHPGHQ